MLQTIRGNEPLSRAALAGRFAAVLTVAMLFMLPLVPTEYFYHRSALFTYNGSLRPGVHWRIGLMVPIVAISAFAPAYLWATRAGRVYFSHWRGLLCAVLTFFYAAMLVSLLGHVLSDETLPFFRLAAAGLLFLPFLWLLPAIGAVTGSRLAQRITREPTSTRARFQHTALPLLLSTLPFWVVLGIAICFPPPEHGISKATLQLSDEVWTRFDAGDAAGVYELFSDDSKKLLDHGLFVAKLAAAWRTANALPADATAARNRPERGTRQRLNWRIFTLSKKFEVISLHTAAAGEIYETAIFDLSSGRPELYGIAISFNSRSPADNIIMPTRVCDRSKAPMLNCADINEPLPRPWF